MNTKKIALISSFVLISALAFFSGIFYQKNYASKNADLRSQNRNQNAGRDLRMEEGGSLNMQRQRMLQGKFVNGEILSNDGTIITVKLRDGGSRIVFVTPNTQVEKYIMGEMSDVTVGKTVMINGDVNPDSSLNAASIQVK